MERFNSMIILKVIFLFIKRVSFAVNGRLIFQQWHCTKLITDNSNSINIQFVFVSLIIGWTI